MLRNASLLAAVLAQPTGAVTPALSAPPPEPKPWLAGAMANVQVPWNVPDADVS
jgi:hypothetical protein